MDVDCVCKGNAQKLRRNFNNIAFKDGESVNDFYMCITSLVNNLRLLDNTIDEIEVVQKMLQVVPERFDQVAISIETLLDVGTMNVEGSTGRLRTVEQRHEAQEDEEDEPTLMMAQVASITSSAHDEVATENG
ncbi:hypothetical protein AXG93_3857s1150 [Marchantia polymorpha subsp. ruderalis]|uniref:Uncharacterized protein n=1 Tax=Marchantia polymorpha subsp. ruderalis TaxID=1480154 RepID=A0A176W393_MARPO|nr:hypothetical protein AXG93_3857s1150 [Marchantia polymorpha subsp. ruderalis]